MGLCVSVVALAACAMPADMQRARPASGWCPAEVAAREAVDTTQLRWYRAADERDVRLASSWCATLGPPALRLQPTAPFPSWTGSGSVHFATWNAQVGGGDILGFLEGELGLRCDEVGDATRLDVEPFVLSVQEAPRYDDRMPVVDKSAPIPWTIDPGEDGPDGPDIVAVAEQCGLALVYVPSARNGSDEGSRPREDIGAALLSTLPLSTPIAFELPFEGGRKVGVAATAIAPGGQRVRFVSVHLDVASTLVRTVFSGNQTRARQARGLIDGINQAERDGPVTNVVVVGGDFNTWAANESALQYMGRAFPDSPRWDGRGTRGAYPADHIFFRRGSFGMFDLEDYRRIEDSYDSDHHGRRVELTFTPASE